MQRLLWKEFREKRVWFVLLPVISLVSELMGRGFTFVGDVPSFWALLSVPLLFALLMGFTAYSSELKAGVIQFLYSRPASWKQILAVKLAVGMMIILISTGVAFAVYMIQYPQDYRDFAVPPMIFIGIGYALCSMIAAYAVGAACSVVMPGVIGGVLTALVLWMLSVVYYSILPDSPSYGISWLIGAGVAAIVVIRFGLTLSSVSRISRYALTTVIVVACISPIDLLMPQAQSGTQVTNISPNGRYAITVTEWYRNWRLVRLNDGKQIKLNLKHSPDQYVIRWTDSNTVVLNSWGEVILIRIDADNRVSQKTIQLRKTEGGLGYVEPSPDGAFVAVSIPTGSLNVDEPQNFLELIDVKRARKLDIHVKSAEHFMWISNRQIRYVDLWGRYHTLHVPE